MVDESTQDGVVAICSCLLTFVPCVGRVRLPEDYSELKIDLKLG
jgi:hypothetical protein